MLHNIQHPFLMHQLSQKDRNKHTHTHTPLCLRLPVNWLFTIKIPRVQIKRYTSLTPPRVQVYWIYCFLKHCSRKHKLQETFTALYASWRRHSTFDPWTVKTTAGIYKEREKGASLPPLEIGRWKTFTARTYQIHQRVIFTTFHQQQLDLTPTLTIAALA